MNDKTRLAKDGKSVRISQRGRVRLNIQARAVLLQVPSDVYAAAGGDSKWWCSSRGGLKLGQAFRTLRPMQSMLWPVANQVSKDEEAFLSCLGRGS